MSERYDIYHKENYDDDGNVLTRTWHIMDTANRCADMGFTFDDRQTALAKAKRLDRGL